MTEPTEQQDPKQDEPELWCAEGNEGEPLTCYEMGDAIEEELQKVWPDIPETIELVGWAVKKAEPLDAVCVLEHTLEMLDTWQDLGNPDAITEPTPAMKEAAEVFCAVVLREYVPWGYEEVCRETIDVREWAQKNDPELFVKMGSEVTP